MTIQDDQAPGVSEAEGGRAELKSTKRAVPGLWLALGVFAGNLIFVSMFSSSVAKGFLAGAGAGFLVFLVHQMVPGLRTKA